MKVSRPASPQPSTTAGKLAAPGRGKPGDFAAKLHEAAAKGTVPGARTSAAGRATTSGPGRTTTSAPTRSSVSDIGAALKAGKLTPQAAIDKVIDRIVAQQLGIHAAPAAKEKIGAALRERLADDPLLSAKVRALSGES